MVLRDVKPTRMQLIELKKRIKLSEKGHKLLKMKRDGLIIEFFELLEEAKKSQKEIAAAQIAAERAIAIASAVEGSIAVRSAALSMSREAHITLETKNIMGVVVPKIEATDVTTKLTQRGYGLVGSSARIDQAVEAYERLVMEIVRAAEVETALKKLLDEIEKTKRRVNALEFKVIPELKETKNFIAFRLEEMERENIFRLKRIKAKGEAAAEEAEAEHAAATAAA